MYEKQAPHIFKKPWPNPRGLGLTWTKHHRSSVLLLTLLYSLRYRGVDSYSKPITINDNKYKVCYLIIYSIVFNTTHLYHGAIVAGRTSVNQNPATQYDQDVGFEDRPESTLRDLPKPGPTHQQIHDQTRLLRPTGLQGRQAQRHGCRHDRATRRSGGPLG